MAAKTVGSRLVNQVMFASTGALSLGASAFLFRDLADLSQWVLKADRSDVFWTFQNKDVLAATAVASSAANTLISLRTRCVPRKLWALVNVTSAGMLFSGFVNPSLMMRSRNHGAVYIPANTATDVLSPEETVVVTRLDGGKPCAFPDTQLLRPHTVRVGTQPSGVPVTMTYCGLTNLGMAFETPNHEDGTEMELVPLTQLENNLVLMDKATGHLGQQINGMDENAVCKRLGYESYHKSARRPADAQLEGIPHDVVGKEVATWRMTLGNFVKTYPDGDVFINDYKMNKSLSAPVTAAYDSIMDVIFSTSIDFQRTNPEPVFPTVKHDDTRLASKDLVWGFNVGDDYVVVTERFVRESPDGVKNMTVGGVPVVASWDPQAESLGIWRRPSARPISTTVDVHGRTGSAGTPLERLSTVKAGAYWIVYSNFFPQARLNPSS